MKNKKNILKTILIILGVLLAFYIITVSIRYSIITKISNKQQEVQGKENYYIVFSSYNENNDTTLVTKFWRKGNIYKSEKDDGELLKHTFWYNADTEEKYMYNKVDKIYKEEDNARWETSPKDIIHQNLIVTSKKEENSERLLFAMNLFNSIKTVTYNNVECYAFSKEYDAEAGKEEKVKQETYFAKDSGLFVGSREESYLGSLENGELKEEKIKNKTQIKYEFDKVTDEDIEKLDFNEYNNITQ